MSIDLTNPIFHNEDASRAYFEALHWPNGPICPHCGLVNEATALHGDAHRAGLYKCRACEEQFSVTVGTVMESSHIPLHKWAFAFRLMNGSKKGVSAHQLMRELGLGSYRTAWFLAHRVREAMADYDSEPLGGKGKTVEVDETFIGRKQGAPIKQGGTHKNAVLTLVERRGRARSFHIERVAKDEIIPIVKTNISNETHVMTDEAARYTKLG